MVNSSDYAMTMESTERQRVYVEEMKKKAPGAGIVFADAFLRGMREIGYKDPSWALAEMIDNSIQAAADTIEIALGFNRGNKSKAKPDLIAVLDNGCGMIPQMISYAVRWGGTDRENDRSGFGRYGYGLPSSAVSMASRYTVFSKVDGEEWHSVTVDISDLASVAYDATKVEEALKPRAGRPPAWLESSTGVLRVEDLSSGTIIILEELDRLRELPGWITRKVLVSKMHQHLGVIYRHWLPERQIIVDGEATQPVDPLFLMEHARHFKENSDRARRVDARSFIATTKSGKTGAVRIRASIMPPTFQRVDPLRTDPKNMNSRWEIMRKYNGLLICREGRQIDIVGPKWTRFQTYDANLKVEIDFDASLDEFFGITTSKQQIEIREEMWEMLRNDGENGGGLFRLIKDIRKELTGMRSADEAKRRATAREAQRRLSEAAMEKAEKFKTKRPGDRTRKKVEGERNIDTAASEIAVETGKAKETVLDELREFARRRRWFVDFKALEEAPFYVPKQLGEQRRLVLNTDHPFYQKIYSLHPDVNWALEILLFILSEGELDAEGLFEEFYKSARHNWSERLRHALLFVEDDEALNDRANAYEEDLYSSEDGDSAEA